MATPSFSVSEDECWYVEAAFSYPAKIGQTPVQSHSLITYTNLSTSNSKE